MSQKPSRFPRNRSSSMRPNRTRSNIPEDGFSNISLAKPRIISAVKIEDKLLSQQINYKRKLETLKKTVEQEQMKEVQCKPKISDKSRALAEKAEKRLQQQYTEIKVKQENRDEKMNLIEKQPEINNRSFSGMKMNKIPTSSTPTAARNPKKRTKSLLNLSVLERNEAWLEEKNSKIDIRKKAKEEEALAECTFSPKIKNKNQHNRSVRDGASSNLSYISSPHSIEKYEFLEQNSRVVQSKNMQYRPIAPYQVNVAFKSGIDLNSFMKRAK